MQNIKIYLKRNTYRIESYRLKSVFNLSNNNFDKFFYKSKLRKFVFKLIYRIISIIKFYLNCKPDIHSIDFNLTTSCNLRCKDCASLMPYYDKNNQWTIDYQTFKSDLDKLLNYANKIYRLKLIGGEPLLVPDLENILEYACSKKQIVSVLITTNGKLIPSDNLCSILSKYKKKALFELSDYSEAIYDLKHKEIKNKLKEYNIYYFISNYSWWERGEIYRRNKTIPELIETYNNCFQQACLSLFDGKIYNCTKAAAINRLTDFKFQSDETIDIRCDKNPVNKLRNFYTKNYYSACCFCPDRCNITKDRGIQSSEHLEIINRG